MHRGHRNQDLASMAFVQNHSLLHEWVDLPFDATRFDISSVGLPNPESASSNHANQSKEAAVRSGFTDDSASPPSLLYSHGSKTDSPVRGTSNDPNQSFVNTWQSSTHGTDDRLSTTAEDDVIICHEKKVAKSGRCAANAPASPRIKQEPSACETRQQTLRLRRRDRAIENSRADDSSVASVDAVRIGRWPPKYVSPSPSSQRSLRRSSRKRQPSWQARDRLLNAPSNAAYVNLLDSPSDDNSDESSQPLIKRFRKNQSVASSAKQPLPVRRQCKASARQKPSRHSPAGKKLPANPNESQRLADPEKMVTFYFFAGDKDFGALPASMKQCKAAKAFFDKSALALSLSSGRVNEYSVKAVTVAIDGFDWPLVIPWRDADGFRIMMQKVADHVSQGHESLNIKVTCMAKKWAEM